MHTGCRSFFANLVVNVVLVLMPSVYDNGGRSSKLFLVRHYRALNGRAKVMFPGKVSMIPSDLNLILV